MNHSTRRVWTIRLTLLTALLLGFVSANSGYAQSRQAARADDMRRARQSLLHTRTARRVLHETPDGYRMPHERVVRANQQVPIEPLPTEANYNPEAIFNEGANVEGGVEGEIVDDGGDQGSAPLGQWDAGWDGDDLVADDCGGCEDPNCDSCTGSCEINGELALGGPVLNLQNASIFAGVQGFTGPFNLQRSGSFGFHEGFNIGIPLALFPTSGTGVQIGLRTAQSSLSGADFTSAQRNQTFFTVGGFRRADAGFQGGLVVDFLRDSWYNRVDLNQLRGQISWKYACRHEWGYWFTAAGTQDTTQSPIVTGRTDTWEPTSLHAAFYQRRMDIVPGGLLTLFAGFSSESDGLIGTKAFLPLTEFLALQSDFSYLTPNEPTTAGGTLNESWNLGLSIVLRLGLNAQSPAACYSPMFDVADNGTFMVDRISTP